MNILHSLSVAAAGLSLSHVEHGPMLLRSPGLPEGSGGKHRARPLIGLHGCWRPGAEHLPASEPSRQVRRRVEHLQWKQSGRPTFAAIGVERPYFAEQRQTARERALKEFWAEATNSTPEQDLRAAWRESREEASREEWIPAGSVIVAPPGAKAAHIELDVTTSSNCGEVGR